MNALPRSVQRFAASRQGAWIGLHVSSKIDPWLLKRTRGRLSTIGRDRVLLVRHTGARTGRPRETPLMHLTDGARVVLVASNGGGARHPAWYYNLRANPDCRILVSGRSGRYRAGDAKGAERERLWRLAVDAFGGYETYQARAGCRVIPVVVLEPVD